MKKGLNLIEITKEKLDLEDLFEDAIDEETGEITDMEQIEELQKEIEAQLVAKSQGIVYFIRERELSINDIDAEIKRLQALKKSYKSKMQSFKDYVVYAMEQMGVKKIETPRGIISLRKSSVVNVPDESKLDMKYMKEKIDYSVDKTKIKKDIKDGKEVKGACIIDKHNLQIK